MQISRVTNGIEMPIRFVVLTCVILCIKKKAFLKSFLYVRLALCLIDCFCWLLIALNKCVIQLFICLVRNLLTTRIKVIEFSSDFYV